MMTGLLTIEAELRDNMGRIIGDRYGVLTTGLSAESIKTAGNIYNYMETLKGALKFRLTVSNVGAAITYIPAPPPAAGVLNVPRSLVTGDSSALGNRIIDALINALAPAYPLSEQPQAGVGGQRPPGRLLPADVLGGHSRVSDLAANPQLTLPLTSAITGATFSSAAWRQGGNQT